MSRDERPDLPAAFARAVTAGIPGILAHQQPDGSIVYDPQAPLAYPQQALFPLAFAWAGLGPDKRYERNGKVEAAIANLGGFLVRRFNARGEFSYDSFGYPVQGVDQRLTYAWTEALRILREAGARHEYDAWREKILAACRTLREHRLEKLVGVRRFLGRVMGTSTNHVALYLTTLYRAGTVLGEKSLAEFALPIARALAEDIHPDGYYEEHGDLLRSAGPTPLYNHLTQGAIALFYEWTGEDVFLRAALRATDFHTRFSYPDGTSFDLIDERCRFRAQPFPWGLHGFSLTPEGRGFAATVFRNWLAHETVPANAAPEILARHCENFLYWHLGTAAAAPIERYDHRAHLTLPAALFRKGDWCVGLSCAHATNAEDPAYRENPFALERQKLLSVWHQSAGLILDGSHSKRQPENSTFSSGAAAVNTANAKAENYDYWPCGGCVGEEDGDWVARATYKTFFGSVRVRVLSDLILQVDLEADFAGSRGPVTAGFTLVPRGPNLGGLSGKVLTLETEAWEATGRELGGGFDHGSVTVKGPEDLVVSWPFSPFNSYAADHRSPPDKSLLRVRVELTPARRRASFILRVKE